jgi:hypothetical protein
VAIRQSWTRVNNGGPIGSSMTHPRFAQLVCLPAISPATVAADVPSAETAQMGYGGTLGLVAIILPVRLVSSRPSAPNCPRSWWMNSRSTLPAGTAASVRQTKGMRRGTPTQRQVRKHLSQLPADRRGGRDPVGVAQDRFSLGQGGQAALPENLGRPSPLPRSRDPGVGRRASRGGQGLGSPVLRGGWPRTGVGHCSPVRVTSPGTRTTGPTYGPAACGPRRHHGRASALLAERMSAPAEDRHATQLAWPGYRQPASVSGSQRSTSTRSSGIWPGDRVGSLGRF